MKISKFSLQLSMEAVGAANIARSAGAGSSFANSVADGVKHDWVLSHSKVVIRTPDSNVIAIGRVQRGGLLVRRAAESGGLLLADGERARSSRHRFKFTIAAFLLQRVQALIEKAIVVATIVHRS